MTESKICTCPSGDGSLRWPCPKHPAVDQADVAAKLTFINGRPAMCGCQVEYSDGGGEYSDVIYVTLCAKHSGSAILDLVATNRIALTPEYEGQWHADLYLDREIPLAKVEGATPAEAVLALMSAERIDPEQESVEQAGGDERAEFERAFTVQEGIYFDDKRGEYRSMNLCAIEASDAQDLNLQLQGWQARAALAQPSPVPVSNIEFARKLFEEIALIADDEKCIRMLAGALTQPSPAPELESVDWASALLDVAVLNEALTSRDSAERLQNMDAGEVIRRAFGKLKNIRAQHDRIVGALRAESAKRGVRLSEMHEDIRIITEERDAAQARVAELEGQSGFEFVYDSDELVAVPRGLLGAACHAIDKKRYAPRTIAKLREYARGLPAPVAQAQQLNDLDKQCRDDVARALGLRPNQERGFAWSYLLASIKSCVKASGDSAQAQHSVPDGAADLCRFLAKLYCELDGLRYSTAKLPAEQIADALIFKWPVLQGARNQLNIKRISEQPYDESKLHSAIAAMLAAAPAQGGE
ncbi:TPA: hypothetical protein NID12_000185 [Pseudomonas aeruginosa]|nr:hypothetical protein [Pseudomonas aeruginosa]